MATIHTIRRKVLNKEYEFTIPHFFEEMANDYLTFTDVQQIITHGRIRRKFTRDPRGIRYEVVGVLPDGRMVAVICRMKSTGNLLFITTYVTDEL
jgi:hypothetical protein